MKQKISEAKNVSEAKKPSWQNPGLSGDRVGNDPKSTPKSTRVRRFLPKTFKK